nr:T9SS type B sorting domain-containing protein [Allomuricauda sp.]
MLKKVLFFFTFSFMVIGQAQVCPNLVSPAEGSSNVPVDTAISWQPDEDVQAYIISLGTTPGGSDLLTPQFSGGTSYTPPLGLPEDTDIYVTITLFFFDQPNITCPSRQFRTGLLTSPPTCTQLTNPLDMDININPATNISWGYASGATGYRISLGTTAGGTDILNNFDAGNTLTFNPVDDLPPEQTIHVTITPYNRIGQAIGCSSQLFTTSAVSELPNCTSMIYPPNGEINVPLTPLLQWNEVPDAIGYRVTIGSSPNQRDILDNATFYTNSTLVIDFEPNNTFFIKVTPFNDAGEALGCIQESFTTLLGCGPYLDIDSGEFVTLNPKIDFPETVSFCEDQAPLSISSSDDADGFRWFQIDQFGQETLISETREASILEHGTYRYEAYTLVSQNGNEIECPTSMEFNVVSSETPTIDRLDFVENTSSLQVTVHTSEAGNYEYAVDNRNGPYSNSNIFSGLEPGSHTFYVRDKNGCGIAEKTFTQDLTVEGFPKFFTPNGDNINDFWQFIQPPNADEIILKRIYIFNRYGTLLKEISQNSIGWDGNFRGRPLPAGEYWFKAIDDSNREVHGHFALKR